MQKQVRRTPDSCAQRPTSSRSSRTFSRDVPLCVGNRPRKWRITALKVGLLAGGQRRRRARGMSSSPDKLLLNESRSSPSAAGLSAPSRGTSSSTARSSCSLPARADREQCMILGRGVLLSTSEPAWPLLVANCCGLWQPLPANTEARLLLRARRPWLIFECTYSSEC